MYASGEDACDGLDPVSPRIGDEKPCDGGELGGVRPERGHTVMLEPRDKTVKLPGEPTRGAGCAFAAATNSAVTPTRSCWSARNHTPRRTASASGFLDLHEAENSP